MLGRRRNLKTKTESAESESNNLATYATVQGFLLQYSVDNSNK